MQSLVRLCMCMGGDCSIAMQWNAPHRYKTKCIECHIQLGCMNVAKLICIWRLKQKHKHTHIYTQKEKQWTSEWTRFISQGTRRLDKWMAGWLVMWLFHSLAFHFIHWHNKELTYFQTTTKKIIFVLFYLPRWFNLWNISVHECATAREIF